MKKQITKTRLFFPLSLLLVATILVSGCSEKPVTGAVGPTISTSEEMKKERARQAAEQQKEAAANPVAPK